MIPRTTSNTVANRLTPPNAQTFFRRLKPSNNFELCFSTKMSLSELLFCETLLRFHSQPSWGALRCLARAERALESRFAAQKFWVGAESHEQVHVLEGHEGKEIQRPNCMRSSTRRTKSASRVPQCQLQIVFRSSDRVIVEVRVFRLDFACESRWTERMKRCTANSLEATY